MKQFSFALALVVAFLMGCATQVKPMEGTAPNNVDSKKLETAIQKAAIERGWMTKPVSPGVMELTLNNREHKVVIDVKYHTGGYTMNYKDSQNMDYNPTRNTIHKKYDMWLSNLKRSIDKNLVGLIQ